MAGNNPASIEAAEERELNSLINDAVRDTEAEIFSDALGTEELENDGDTSLETMGEGLEGDDLEDEVEAEEPVDGETPEARADGEHEDETEVEEPARSEDGRFQRQDEQRGVPPGRLREEAEGRRQAEARANQLEANLAAMAQRLAGLEVGLQAPRPNQQAPVKAEPPPKPDMFSDPDGHEAWIIARAEERAQAIFQQGMQTLAQRQQQEWNYNLDQNLVAHSQGERGFEFQPAYKALTSLDKRDPQVRALVQSILYSSDPGSEMFKWWDQNGGPEYRERTRERLHAEYEQRLAQLGEQPPARQSRQESRPQRTQAQPRQVFRGPQSIPSLNGATSANPSRANDPDLYNGSPESVWDFATRP